MTGSLTEEIRRIERRLTRQDVPGMQRRTSSHHSFLDRLGRLLDTRRFRGSIIDRKMQYRSNTVDSFGLDPIHAEGWRPVLEFMYRSYWRVETSGMENIPDHGRAIIVANHAGTLPYDGAMIMCAVRYDHPAHRTIRPLIEDFIFHFPFIGAALNRIGCVRACQDNAERLLSQEQLVAVFPEGMKGISKLYRHRYQLQRFGRGGFIKLALQTRAPIIPAAVIGAEEIYPMMGRVSWLAKYLGIPYVPLTPTFPWLGPLGAILLPSKWQIRFGDPLHLADQFGADALDDRILVNQLAEKVRSTIQGMVDEGLASRRSVLFG